MNLTTFHSITLSMVIVLKAFEMRICLFNLPEENSKMAQNTIPKINRPFLNGTILIIRYPLNQTNLPHKTLE